MPSPTHAPDALEIHSVHPLLRAATMLVWSGFGAFMIGLALHFPSTGHTFGYFLGAACLWTALYWWRLPEVRLVLKGDGIDYLDGSLGVLLRFPMRHAAWADVTTVDTRQVVSRYGSYLRTRVTVRDSADPRRSRRFDVTSRHDGYTRFLDELAARTGRSPAGIGVGARSAHVHHEFRQRMGGQFALITGVLLAAAALILITAFARR